ncbi:MAG: ABC transporter substrate-binding protein [Acidimicrobiales bacterium]
MTNLHRKVRTPRLRTVLASACAASLVAAYGGVAASSASTVHRARATGQSFAGQTLTVLDGAPTGADVKETQAYYNYLAKVFHQQTGATLQYDYYTSPSQEVTTIETSTVSGSGPDVISYGTSFVGTLQATGDFPAMSTADWNAIGGRKSFIQADLFDSGTSATNDIGVPNETNPFVLAYNTEYFKKAGITAPPHTWSQFVTDAQKIQKAVPGVYGAGFDPQDPYDPWKNMWFYSHALSGLRWISANGKKINIANAQDLAALRFYFSLDYKYHVVPPQALTWNGADMGSAFTAGKIGMAIIASYGYTAAAVGTKVQGHLGYALLPDIPYGLTSLPKGGRPVETETTGNYWAIPKYAASKRALALAFEKVSVSPQVQLEQFKLLGWMPVNAAGVKAVETYSPASKPFIGAESSAYPTSIAPVWSYVETGMLTAIHNISSNLATSGKWNEAYAASQLKSAQAAAQAQA